MTKFWTMTANPNPNPLCSTSLHILLLCLQLNRNSHYQVPQSGMKPVPPPKPVHLKLSRATSAQDASQLSPQAKPRKLSEVDPHNRVPPPKVPPPVGPVCVQMTHQYVHKIILG